MLPQSSSRPTSTSSATHRTSLPSFTPTEPGESRPSTAETTSSRQSLDIAENNATGSESAAEPVVQAPFQPFFTLIENAHTSTPHHPAVHYIFSDDDAADTLGDTLLNITLSQRRTHTGSPDAQQAEDRTKERYVLLTLGEDGKSVAEAHSLTGDWQLLGAEVSAAPMLEGGEDETGGLMLRIQGTEGLKEEDEKGEGGLEAAVDRFRERMGELKRVVEGQRQGYCS